MRLQDINVNVNAIPVFNAHKEEIFRKIDAGETLTNEEEKIKNDFTFLCESLANVIGLDITNLDKVFQLSEAYKNLTGEELILDEEKTPKM